MAENKQFKYINKQVAESIKNRETRLDVIQRTQGQIQKTHGIMEKALKDTLGVADELVSDMRVLSKALINHALRLKRLELLTILNTVWLLGLAAWLVGISL